MTEREKAFLRGVMERGVRYLEYGAGASTRTAASCSNLEMIRSVESDPAFVEAEVLPDPGVREARESGRLAFSFIYLGTTGEWGHPKDESKRHLWPNYALAPYTEPATWDVILVDGRFRVACVLLAALEAPRDITLLVHDFTWRPEYRPMLYFMDCVRTVDTFAQLRRRSDFNPERARRALRHYLYVQDDRARLPLLKRSLYALSHRSSRLVSKLQKTR